MSQTGGVVGEFKEDGRFGVGIGNGAAIAVYGTPHDLLRCQYRTVNRFMAIDLGNSVVLAVAAMEVAAHGGDGIGAAARHDMEQRLFLDRIDMLGTELPVDQAVEGAPAIFADGANAPSTITDQTFESAQAASNAFIVLPLVEHGLFHGRPPEMYLLTPNPPQSTRSA